MEELNTKEPEKLSLKDIRLEISLQELFNLSYYRHLDDKIVVSEERFNLLAKQPNFNELIHVFKYESQGVNLYRLQQKEDYERSIIGKDKLSKEKEADLDLARMKHKTIEKWKSEARIRLTNTGKLNKNQIETLLIRCMNPKNDRDKLFAGKLKYPYGEDNSVDPISLNQQQQPN